MLPRALGAKTFQNAQGVRCMENRVSGAGEVRSHKGDNRMRGTMKHN